MVKQPQQRYHEYSKGTVCSVEDCNSPAEFEVYLYDYYDFSNEEFFEQDYTCPFLCQEHMEENERRAKGARVPRGMVFYPYSNRHHAQGYTIYAPVTQVFPQIYTIDHALKPALIQNFVQVNDSLIRYLTRHPELLHKLDPYRFEEVVAEIFRNQGFEVEMTPKSRDGGKDIYAAKSDSFGTTLYLIECKRYSSSKKVGVEVVRGLYGVLHESRATKGIIATTSTFSKQAIDFATPLKYQLSLRDYEALCNWLRSYK